VHCINRCRRRGRAGKAERRRETLEQERVGKQRQATKQKGKRGDYKGQVKRDSNIRAGGKRSVREQGCEEKSTMQRGGRTIGAAELWEERCELERRIERRSKMIANIRVVTRIRGMTLLEQHRLSEEEKRIEKEMDVLAERMWVLDGQVRWVEAQEDEERARADAERVQEHRRREEEEEEEGEEEEGLQWEGAVKFGST
jgi:hypothetical protein